MKLSKAIIQQQEEIKKEMTNVIESFLKILEDKELEIIKPHLDILCGNFSCYHQQFDTHFYYVKEYQEKAFRVRKSDSDYKIVSIDDDGITVEAAREIIKIPYEYDKKFIDDFIKKFFKQLLTNIQEGLKRKNRNIEENENYKKEEKDIRKTRTSGRYEYSWKDCPNCYSDLINQSSGEITVGTGKWEDDPYYDGQREVTIRINCPRCHRTGGLLIFSEDGWGTKERPCSKYAFERNKNDFMKLLAD